MKDHKALKELGSYVYIKSRMLHLSLYVSKSLKEIRNCLLLRSLQIACADRLSADELSIKQGGTRYAPRVCTVWGGKVSSIEYEFRDLTSLYTSAICAI